MELDENARKILEGMTRSYRDLATAAAKLNELEEKEAAGLVTEQEREALAVLRGFMAVRAKFERLTSIWR